MKNLKIVMLLVLTIMVAALSFTSCDVIENLTSKIPGIGGNEEHDHVFSDATCTAPKTCGCGATEGEALGHTIVIDEAVDPTCTETGLTAGEHCSVCEEVLVAQTEIAASGHSYKSIVTAPTCTEAGYTTYTCTCGDSYVADEVAASGHSYDAVVTAPTCTETGYTTYTCTCGDSYVADEVAVIDHTFIDSKCECGLEYVAPVLEWVLVTELKTGDIVVIGNPKYNKLLSANKVSSSSYYNKGVDYTADDFSKVTDAELWVVTVNEDGSYYFTSLTGERLGLAASYSSLNSAGPNFSWSLVSKSDTTFLIKNIGRNTYLEWYSSKNNWSTYTAGNTAEYYLSFYALKGSGEDHVHNHISEVHATTCTEDGYTRYTCECGDSYVVAGEAAFGHNHNVVVTAPTCTEAGYTTHTCNCGDTYITDEVAAIGHSYADGKCSNCGEEDPAYHVHSYDAVVTAPTCSATGYTTYTCSCGDTYTGDETEIVDHVDNNLDITCDFDGCTKRILPAADSKVSLYTANCMIIVSLSSSYYVEGVVTEIVDAANGIFIIEDEAGDTILIRLPKNADGVSYSKWTDVKIVVGDTISVYGKPSRNTGSPTTQKAKVEGGVLTIINHTHSFSEPTCTEPAACDCLATSDPALGHVDEDKSGLCDRCDWNMKLVTTHITIATDTTIANGVLDENKTHWTWSGDNFDVEIAKGSSTYSLYTTAKAYMQLKKLNTLTVVNKNGLTISFITIYTTNATQLNNLKGAIGTAYEYSVDEDALSVTIALNSTENFVLTNNGSATAYVSGVEIAYEKPAVKADPVTVVMANTITDTQSTNMTGGNDAALVGLDANIFTVTSDKGSYSAHPILYYKDTLTIPNQIRLYNHSSANGNSITVSVSEGYEIVSIKISFTVAGRGTGYVVTDAAGTEIYSVATDVTFSTLEEAVATIEVNSSSFTFKNVHTNNNKQIWIGTIEIVYQEV